VAKLYKDTLKLKGDNHKEDNTVINFKDIYCLEYFHTLKDGEHSAQILFTGKNVIDLFEVERYRDIKVARRRFSDVIQFYEAYKTAHDIS
jgi:hypothetical protein